MKVKLVGYTQPSEDFKDAFNTAKELIAYCARVSNPSNQFNNATADKLLDYLKKHKHWSPFEMASATLEIETTRDIARQLLRHHSFSFQEFCIAGDTLITLELPSGTKSGKKSAYKREIQHLYKLQESGRKLPECVRVFDEETGEFTTCAIKEVFKTGVKPVFKITLDNGKTITSTKEHKFLTESGFQTLEDAVGLVMSNDRAMMTKDVAFGCNGIPVHQSKEWMQRTKEEAISFGEGIDFIATKAGVSYHTIRKWLKRLGLSFTPVEKAKTFEVWNKGKFGYSNKKHSIETIEKMRASAKRGPDSNLWRGGVDRSERLKITDWANSLRSEFLIKFEHKCSVCGSSKNLELHHIVPVFEDSSKAYDKENITVVCKNCHDDIHNLRGDAKTWRNSHKGNSLTVEWSKVVSIEYVGEQMTYDMEVDHISHNYVGNGIVTHNSQRYADPTTDLSFELREARLQDQKNRQNSIILEDSAEARELKKLWNEQQQKVIKAAQEAYRWAVSNGIAKEQARVVLPEGNTMSRLYVQGTIRSYIHYIEVRTDESTQLEHRELAQAVALAISTIFDK